MAEKVNLQSLKCPICHDAFKAPTLLSCGHSYCNVCLDDYDQQHRGQNFMECPLCKKHTQLGENRVAGLALNFSLTGVEEELDLNVDGKSLKYCVQHNGLYNDIFCQVCKKFICMTCLSSGEHQGHMYMKKERMAATLEKGKNTYIKKIEVKKAHINEYINNTKKRKRDVDSHLDQLEMEMENSVSKKIQIIRGHKRRLSKKIADMRNKSDESLTKFIRRQKQSLHSFDVKSTLMGQEDVANTSTCKLLDSDAIKTHYIEKLEVKRELERDINDPSIAHALQEIENTRFFPSDEHDLDLGTLDQDATVSDQDASVSDQDASLSDQDASVSDQDTSLSDRDE